MSLVKNFVMLAHYNQRINQQLLEVCYALPAHCLNKDTQSFFPNIISYWNHILFGDLILLNRIANFSATSLQPSLFTAFPKPVSVNDIYSDNLPELAQVRQRLDQLIVNFCNNLTEQEVAVSLSYTTTEGQEVTKPLSDVIQHLFNHQTHHRGQLTCILSQFGSDYGCMDLPVVVSEGSLGL